MIRSSHIKLVVAGLTSFGVVFQALLLSVHLSLMVAPQSDATSLALNVLCSGHTSADVPVQDAPADKASSCSLCLFCSKSAAGSLALLPQTAILLIVAPSQTFSLPVTPDRLAIGFPPHPPSRGPPAFA